MPIIIDESRNEMLPEISLLTVMEKYAADGEVSPQQSFARAAAAFADDDAHAQRLYDYASKLWFGFSSPILSNGGTKKGLPISCYLSYLEDSIKGLTDHFTESAFLASGGGGIGSCWNDVRSSGTKTSKGITSTGLIPHLHVADAEMLAYSQGETRRGKVSFNLDISHPEIEEFIDITNKKGGDQHRRAVHSFNCVSITDDFMGAVANNGTWDLIDPHSKQVVKTVSAKDLWIKILTSRMQEGIPYIHYIDTSNRMMPQFQKDKGLKINQTNLCCVTGDQIVDTEEGFYTVKELYESGHALMLFNGQEYVSASAMNLIANNTPVFKIHTDAEEHSHTVTLNHKVMVEGKGWVEAGRLVLGDRLVLSDKTTVAFTWLEPLPPEDVYCPEVYTKDHAWVANGFITHNSEITLPTDKDRTAVCCLSSVNLEAYDQWKDDPLFIEDLIRMLDNVITYFIDHAPSQIHKAIYSASQERALGLGAFGWHSYLQSRMIPFESGMAISATRKIFGHIQKQAKAATMKLARERGGCPDSEGLPEYERPRNSCLLAIAPTATNSIICGNTSPSVEPLYSNLYNQKTQNGLFPRKNNYLQEYLKTIHKDTPEVWDSIGKNGGSVQHLDFVSDHAKKVFKTAFEIDQYWIIEQAAHRQEFIDQAQSINLFLKPDENKEYIHAIHYLAWLRGVKTLYYVRSKAPKKADDVGAKVERVIRKDYTQVPIGEVGYKGEHDGPPEDSCISCSG